MDHLKFENTKVFNFENALRGMRNPKNSWRLSDSAFGFTSDSHALTEFCDEVAESYADRQDDNFRLRSEYLQRNGISCVNTDNEIYEYNFIGAKDMRLAKTLISGGSEHRKFLRQIFVTVDITAPLFWWKEADTYGIGVTKNSTSTMHKLTSAPIQVDYFKFDSDLDKLLISDYQDICFDDVVDYIVSVCEQLRLRYIETKDERYWKALIELLPEAWNQKRTITMNYENLLSIYRQRKSHKLTEWREDFIGWVKTLPYANDLIIFDDKHKNS